MKTNPRKTVAMIGVILSMALTLRLEASGTRFTNGRWFDGTSFQDRDFFVVDGVLSETEPEEVDQVVDLAGGWIVPPYGEAHNHNLTRPVRQHEVQRYLSQGVVYAMVQNNIPTIPGAETQPHPLDISWANGGLTAPGGHVVELYEGLVERGIIKMPKEALDGLAFFVVDSQDELDQKWKQILAGNPDFIKLYLGFSDEYGKRRSSPEYYGARGLNPQLVPEIVRRAHEAGLRVSAHIETTSDIRLALKSGVDIVAHLPGWRVGAKAGYEDEKLDRWLISEADARAIADSGTSFVTTALAGGSAIRPGDEHYDATRKLHRHNLEMLSSAGAHLVIGSDFYSGTGLIEALFLAKQEAIQGVEPLGVFDNLTLLRMLSQETPQVIFPDRKIGELKDEYEANFLVLEANPLEDINNLRKIRKIYKAGEVIWEPEKATD